MAWLVYMRSRCWREWDPTDQDLHRGRGAVTAGPRDDLGAGDAMPSDSPRDGSGAGAAPTPTEGTH
jgi:hypothetical protein